MHRRPFSWVGVAGLGLAGVVAAGAVAMSAATALAALSAASPFELVFTGRYEPWPECEVNPSDLCFDTKPAVGTFTSGAPFCGSGSGEDVGYPQQPGVVGVIRRYTCADGSGSLTLSMSSLNAEFMAGSSGGWKIVEGSGRFEGLRGMGTYTGELLGGNPADLSRPIVFRATAQGFAGVDAGGPSVDFTSVIPTKLQRPAGAYSLRVALSLRDDFEGVPVFYSLRVTEGGRLLASTRGETASGSVSTMLRIRPSSKRVRTVVLRLYGSDWLGNGQSLERVLRLPR